jgi:hypothetical protein
MSIMLWAVFALSVGFFSAAYFALHVVRVPVFPGLIHGMFATHWLATIAASLLAFQLSSSFIQRRFWVSLILSLFATASSYWGLTFVSISTTRTMNGQSQTIFDSRWFFAGSIVLATLAFGFTLWKRWRLRCVA